MAWNLQDYEPVENRIKAFYDDHRKGRILTEITDHNEDFSFVVFKATVYRTTDTEPAATGYAYEKATQKGVNATSHIENCETSAIGRALANLGYAAKGKRPSREEMQKVQNSAGSDPVPAQARGSKPQAAPAPSSPPQNSGEEVDAASQPPQAGDVPTSSPDHSWEVIQKAVDNGLVTRVKVQIAAVKFCSEREGCPVPTKFPEVAKCPPDVLDRVVQQLELAA